jgi:muramidase (phage lysozyme)
VLSKFLRRKFRPIKRWLKNRQFVLLTITILFCVGLIIYAIYIDKKRLTVDPSTYTPLLSLIAQAESNDNYNAYFGNAANKSTDFTRMSIAEVLQWQAAYIKQGNASSAVGRYQLLNTTLSGLVQQHGIDTNQKFDKTTQDDLAIALLERRGAVDYVNKELTREQFAANLAKEWAGLPKVTGNNPNDSYYASDGLNKARVVVDEVLKAIEPIRPK